MRGDRLCGGAAENRRMHRRIYHFDGRVQGVGFRYTTQNIAMRYNVHGYVRNLNDGRVELVMEGDDHEMDGVLQCIRKKMNGYIQQVEAETYPATGEFETFGIRHQ
jgi:acylphosphatase